MLQPIALFFTTGGIFMWLILAILAGAVAVIAERTIYYTLRCRNAPHMVTRIAEALNEDRTTDALTIVRENSAPVNIILEVALERYNQKFNYDDIQKGVEETAIKEVPKISSRLNYLALFANISTLAGLLGTIFGLQQSFSSLGLAAADQKATMLASGISQAMNTTAFGLIVAIPCMIAYSVLTNKKASLLEDLDEAVVKTMNYLERKTTL